MIVIKDLKTTLNLINPIPMVDVCVSSEALAKNRFKAINHEDYLFWQEIVKNLSKENIYIDDKSNSIYRISKNSISSSKLKVIKWIWRIYKINNQSLYLNFFKIFLRTILQIVIKIRENKVDLKKNHL